MNNKVHLIKRAIEVAYDNAKYSIYEVPKGILKCKKKLGNVHTHYIVICDHIGDFLITMGYIKAYREKNNIKHITICTTQKFIPLLKKYSEYFDAYKILDTQELYKILRIGSTKFGCRALLKMPNITLVNPGDAFVLECFEYIKHFPNVSLHDCIKYGIFHLEKEEEFVIPKIRVKENNENESMKALICPDARFLRKKENNIFLERIVEELKKAGYSNYTNTPFKDDKVVPGTQSKRMSLQEVCDFAFNGGIVIGIRSGLFDLLAYIPGKIVAVYPDKEYFSLFDLKSLPNTKADMLQVFENEELETEVKKIKKFIGGEKWQ